jgi:hypothetical protein
VGSSVGQSKRIRSPLVQNPAQNSGIVRRIYGVAIERRHERVPEPKTYRWVFADPPNFVIGWHL